MELAYTDEFIEFIRSSEQTGLLYETSLGTFDEGHILLSDKDEEQIVVPIVTSEDWLYPTDRNLYVDDEVETDIDETWLRNVEHRLEYMGSNEIWNGDVCQVKSIDSTGIRMNKSDYYTLASRREQYVAEIALRVRGALSNPARRSLSELESDVYSMMGITYVTIIDAPSMDGRLMIYGERSSELNELSSFRTVCPAGIVQPRHVDGNDFDEMIDSHFTEEFCEEVLGEMPESEWNEQKNEKDITHRSRGYGLDPLRYSTEVGATVEITGETAEYVLDNMESNAEMENLLLYDIDSIRSKYDPLFVRGLTPQTMFSLGLYLAEETDVWSLQVD